MIALRSLLFNIGYYGWTTFCVFALIASLTMPNRVTRAGAVMWARGIGWMLRKVVGLGVTVRGAENLIDGPVIFAAKHQSAWETVMFLDILGRDPAYVVKLELTRIPLFGLCLLSTGAIAVDRSAGARALKALIAGADAAIAAGRSLMIFPEGTRAMPDERRPYQPGVAALYTRLKRPVVPIALNSGLYWGRRGFMRYPGTVLVEILPPIQPGLDRRRFMAELEQRIERATDRLIAEGRGQVAPAEKET